jgi:hypothetical protein
MDRQLTIDGREEPREPIPTEHEALPEMEAPSLFDFPATIAGQLPLGQDASEPV